MIINLPAGDETTDYSVRESASPTQYIHSDNFRPQSRIFIQADGATHVKKMTLKREIVSRKQSPDPQEVRHPNYQVTEADQLGVSCHLPHSKSMPLNSDGDADEFVKCMYHVTVSESSCDVTECDSPALKRDDAHMLLSTLDSRSNPELTEHLDMIAWQLGLLNTKGAPKLTGGGFDNRSHEDVNTGTVPDIQAPEHARLSRIDSTIDMTPPAAVAVSASQLRVRTLSRSCPRRLVTLFHRLSPCRRRSTSQKTEGKEGPRQSRSLSRLFTCTSSRADEAKKSVENVYSPEYPATPISSDTTEPIVKQTIGVLKNGIPQRLWHTEEDKGRYSTLPVSLSFELDSSLQRSRTLPLQSRMIQSLLPNHEHKTPIYLNAALCAYGYGRKPDWKQFSISPSLRRLMRAHRSDPIADGESKGTISTHEQEEPISGIPAPTKLPASKEDPHVTSEPTPPTDQHQNQEEIWHPGNVKYLSEPEFETCNGVPGQTPKDIFSTQNTHPSEVNKGFSITGSPKVANSSTKSIERARSSPISVVPSSDFSTVIDAIRSTTPPMIRRNSAAAVKARAAKIAQARKNELKVIIGEIGSSRPARATKQQEDQQSDQQAATGHILPADLDVRAGVFQPVIRRRPDGHGRNMHLQSIPELSPSDSSFDNECLSPLSQEKSKAQSMNEISDIHFSDQQKRSV